MEMTETRALVRALAADEAVVEVSGGGCGRCHEKGGCGGQQLTQAFCSQAKTFRVANPCRAQVGDTVIVAVPAGAVRFGAHLAYGLPLVGLFAGALPGMFWFGEPGAMLGSIVGLALAWSAARFLSRRGLENPELRPQIVACLATDNPMEKEVKRP